jgi:hypothetical protein
MDLIMDGYFQLPIRIEYSPPGWLLPFLLVSHLGAIIIIFILPVPIWAKPVGVAIVVFALIHAWRRDLRCRSLPAPVLLVCNGNDEWVLSDAARSRTVELLPGSLVHPAMLVLRFRDGNHVHAFFLTPRTVNPDVLRRLRVRLRFKITGKSRS